MRKGEVWFVFRLERTIPIGKCTYLVGMRKSTSGVTDSHRYSAWRMSAVEQPSVSDLYRFESYTHKEFLQKLEDKGYIEYNKKEKKNE